MAFFKGVKMKIKYSSTFLLSLVLVFVVMALSPQMVLAEDGLEFEITLTEEAVTELENLGFETPLDGRIFIIVSNDGSREPHNNVDIAGEPFWAKDVEDLEVGDSFIINDSDVNVASWPLDNFSDLSANGYYIQAFMNIYTTFNRSDGHTLKMHLNSGAGQSVFRAPGNLYSKVDNVYIAPNKTGTIKLELSHIIQPPNPLEEGEVLQQGNYDDTEYVKYPKIKSEIVSEFWGHDMYIGANVLLPKGFEDNPDMQYPVIYHLGHWPGGSTPLGFEEGNDIYEYWMSDDAPRMIVVNIRDANPYYDTSYSVNSANVGPYGDAIREELIPYIEENYRAISEPWARIVAGGSTGGWEAMATKVLHPDFFGGTWSWCPDAIDFHHYQIVNVYEDENAYSMAASWGSTHKAEGEWGVSIERPDVVRDDGNISFTMRQENHYENAVGPNNRSGGQWSIWEAVYSPVGSNGYPQNIWNPVTGEINEDVAEAWKEYDLVHILKENWEELGPKVNGELYIATGTMDTFYLDKAVILLEEFLEEASNPEPDIKIEYGLYEPHCWIGASPDSPKEELKPNVFVSTGEEMTYDEFIPIVAEYLSENAPEEADMSWFE